MGSIKETEPTIELFYEEDCIRRIAELPSVEREKTDLSPDEDTPAISVTAVERKHYKKMELPSLVERGNIGLSYRNDVVEIRLKKRKDQTRAETSILC